MDIELARLITQKGLAAAVAESAVPGDLAASDETTAADKNITEKPTHSDPNSWARKWMDLNVGVCYVLWRYRHEFKITVLVINQEQFLILSKIRLV